MCIAPGESVAVGRISSEGLVDPGVVTVRSERRAYVLAAIAFVATDAKTVDVALSSKSIVQ